MVVSGSRRPAIAVWEDEFAKKLEVDIFANDQAAKAMGGWSRAQVSQYAMLNKLCSDAWSVVATSFSNTVADRESDDVADIATDVAKSKFSENLLRNILDSALRCFQSD